MTETLTTWNAIFITCMLDEQNEKMELYYCLKLPTTVMKQHRLSLVIYIFQGKNIACEIHAVVARHILGVVNDPWPCHHKVIWTWSVAELSVSFLQYANCSNEMITSPLRFVKFRIYTITGGWRMIIKNCIITFPTSAETVGIASVMTRIKKWRSLPSL